MESSLLEQIRKILKCFAVSVAEGHDGIPIIIIDFSHLTNAKDSFEPLARVQLRLW